MLRMKLSTAKNTPTSHMAMAMAMAMSRNRHTWFYPITAEFYAYVERAWWHYYRLTATKCLFVISEYCLLDVRSLLISFRPLLVFSTVVEIPTPLNVFGRRKGFDSSKHIENIAKIYKLK
jgi:hypothetical protein